MGDAIGRCGLVCWILGAGIAAREVLLGASMIWLVGRRCMEGECPCGRCRLCRAGAAPIAARRRPTGYMGNRDGLETAVELFVRRVQAVQFSWPTSGTGDEKRDVLCMCMLEVRK